MNYTEKYHLPQWEETDRIMRTDFNQMCADIENGLTEGSGKRETLAGELRSADAAMRTKELAHILRLAYNHYCTVQDMEPFPTQIGVFHQKAGALSVAPAGMTWRDGVLYAVHAPEAPSEADFFAGITEVSKLHLVEGNLAASTGLAYRFTAPVPGCFKSIFIIGTTNNPKGNPGKFPALRIELINEDTGVTEFLGKSEPLSMLSGEVSTPLEIPIPFRGGYRYLLKASSLDAHISADISLRWLQNTTSFRGGSQENFPGGAISFTQKDDETSQGGVVILRCKVGGKTGSVSLKWNNKTIPAYWHRTMTYKGNLAVDEFIFLQEADVPKTNQLALTFQCGSNCEFYVYDWGVILF